MAPEFSEQIETLIKVTSRLMGVLGREVEMLREMRVSDIETLRDEKNELTLVYEQAVRVIAADPEKLAAIEPALRDTLGDLGQRLDGALTANARALSAVRESHDRLLKAVVDAVTDSRARQKAYNAKGSFETSQHMPRPPALSLTFDRSL